MPTNTSAQKPTAEAGHPPPMTKAVVQRAYGSPKRVLDIVQVARPQMGDDDVLVRVRATSVNTPDGIAVTGEPRILRLKMGLRRPRTPVRGSDLAGVVEAVGRDVADLQPGDEVFGSVWDNEPIQTAGAFAELTVAPASQVLKKPSGVTFEHAAAAVMTGTTALIAMREVGKVREGMRVLVNGASGGVGTMAVQIARLLGGEVTGVCSSRNADLVQSLGASHVIDYMQTDFTQGEHRYDVVLDNVMNHPPAVTARVLTPTGIFIPNSVGTSGGIVGGLPRVAKAMLLDRRGTVRVGAVTCEMNRQNLTALAHLLESGDLRTVIDETYPLTEAAQAVAHMLGHHAQGKVVIHV